MVNMQRTTDITRVRRSGRAYRIGIRGLLCRGHGDVVSWGL